MDEPFLAECLAVLGRTPATMDRLLRDLPEVWTMATEGPGHVEPIRCNRPFDSLRAGRLDAASGDHSWSMARAGHLILSTARRSCVRTTGNRCQRCWMSSARCADDNLASLRALNLQPSDLELRGTHPALGPVTVRQLLATWTAHDLAHILQVSRVMARRYRQDVGPWAEYLSVMK